jgi:hypothetical protein
VLRASLSIPKLSMSAFASGRAADTADLSVDIVPARPYLVERLNPSWRSGMNDAGTEVRTRSVAGG